MDHEGLPVSGELGHHDAAQWPAAISEVEEHLRPALCVWVRSGAYSTQGRSDLPVTSDFIDAYLGEHSSFREHLEEICRDAGMFQSVSEELERYFDWDRFVADEGHSYLVLDAPGGGVYVFSP